MTLASMAITLSSRQRIGLTLVFQVKKEKIKLFNLRQSELFSKADASDYLTGNIVALKIDNS